MIDKIAKINKKFIALLMSVLILISSVVVAYTVNAANTELEETGAKNDLLYQNPFTASGDLIKADHGIDGTDIKPGFIMAQSYIKYYNDRAYCLNMGKHSYTSDVTKENDETLAAWKSLGPYKQEAIKKILALGLEGSLKGNPKNFGTEKDPVYAKKIKNVTSFPISQGASEYHRIYPNTKYGSGTYSDSEIYIAVQLLIWEVQRGWRKPSSLGVSSKPLIKAYDNQNIKNVYNTIVSKAKNLNVVPSFAVPRYKLSNIHTFKVGVIYNVSTKKYELGKSVVLTDNKNVLNNYKAFNNLTRSIKFTDTYNNVTKYLNVKTSVHIKSDARDKTTLTIIPESVTSSALHKMGRASAKETEFLEGKDGTITANLLFYGPASGESQTAQSQVTLKGHNCKIDPIDAYFDLGVDFNNSNNRSFTVQKDMRIKSSDTSSTGYVTDNDKIKDMEKGYYYYVKLPTGSISYNIVENGKVVTKTASCEDAAKVLGLSTSDICYNKTLKEYYVIMGPTNSNGVTTGIDAFLRRYVQNKRGNENLTSDNMPYGNYYIFELGKANKKVWKAQKSTFYPDTTSYLLDMNPSHYIMPEGVTSYHFTYQEHLAAKGDGFAKRDGIAKDGVEYYKRLKRIYRGAGSTESISPTVVNNTTIKIRFKKECSDGQVGDVLFQLKKQNSSGEWVSYDLSNCIADKDYSISFPYINLKDGELATYKYRNDYTTDNGYLRENGYTPYIYLTAGNYMLVELGTITSSSSAPNNLYKKYELRKYYIKPEPKYFSIGSDDTLLDNFGDNVITDDTGTGTGHTEIVFENVVNAKIKLHKTDDENKPLNNAVFQLYNEYKEPMGTYTTATVDGEEGLALIDGLSFKKYYVQEIEAPNGYVCDDTMHEVNLTKSSLDLENGTVSDTMSLTIKDKPIEVPVSKTDFSGKLLKGAKLWVYRVEDSSKVNAYLDKFKNDTSKINENDSEIKGVLKDYWISDNKTHIIKRLSAHSTYVLREIISPDGYLLSDNIVFTVNDDNGKVSYTGKPSDVDGVVMKDDSTKVAFDKVNEEGKSISGALLQVKDSSGKVVKEWTTDGKEYVLDGVLVAGATYTLHEVSAPNVEYELAKDISFKVGTDGVKQVITMKDNYKRGSVTVHKKDEKGNILTGAEFELYKEDGTKVTSTLVKEGSYTVGGSVGTYVVDSKGTFKIDKLRFGSYYLIETKAPEGRMPYGDKIKFTIKDDATLNFEFTVNDDNSVMMNTGGSGYTVPMTVGIAVLLVSILSLIYLKRRKYNSK